MVLESYFLEPEKLLALLSIIPLVIIYLITHKPKKYMFSSVKFFMKATEQKRLISKLNKFMKDPMFFLQLFILVILSAAIASPYINVSESATVEDVVVILDASASMQANFQGSTRFEAAKGVAASSLTDSNTILLVGEFPEILVEHSGRREAERLLATAKAKDTSTNLYDAIILSDDFLQGNKGKVVIISDFLNTASDKDIESAINVLKSKGIRVEIRTVKSDVKNVGIVDVKVNTDKTEIRVKNYNDFEVNAQVVVKGKTENVALKPGSAESFDFETPTELTEVKLMPEDDFKVDNTIYISPPQGGRIKTLYITNNRSKYLYTAFSLIDTIEVDVAEPPIVNNYDYELFVLDNIEKEKLLPGIVNEISKKVSSGSSLIVTAQKDIPDYSALATEGVYYHEINKRLPVFRKENSLTESVVFGSTGSFYFIGGEVSQVAFVEDENITYNVVSTTKKGMGNVLFYGLLDKESSFPLELLYPVFWKRTIGLFSNIEDIKSLNIQTGKIMSFGEDTHIISPDGERQSSKSIVFDEAGFYYIGEKKIATNLANELESDVNGNFALSDFQESTVTSTLNRNVPESILFYVAIAALVLILVEIFIVKYRGDI